MFLEPRKKSIDFLFFTTLYLYLYLHLDRASPDMTDMIACPLGLARSIDYFYRSWFSIKSGYTLHNHNSREISIVQYCCCKVQLFFISRDLLSTLFASVRGTYSISNFTTHYVQYDSRMRAEHCPREIVHGYWYCALRSAHGYPKTWKAKEPCCWILQLIIQLAFPIIYMTTLCFGFSARVCSCG